MQRELVVRAQRGDAEAFSALAGGAIARLHAVAYGILRDPDAADDATQRALIDAWDHIGSLRDPDRFDAWSYRLVVNASYREIRGERSRRQRVRSIAAPAAPDPWGRIEERDAIEAAFRELSREHRAVVVLHHVADLPLVEIARILDVPVGTVGSRLHYATRRLRAALERDTSGLLAAERLP